MIRKIYLAFVLVSVLFQQAHAQANFPNVLNQWLNNYVLKNIQEKIYVQTNSNQYTPGDTIWLKASLVNAINHIPVRIERLFYIDLISPENKVVSHQVYFLQMGFSDSYLTLNSKLRASQYKLIAYTNYMRNFPLDFIFQKTIDLVQPPMERSTWQFKSKVVPFTGGDSVFVSMVGKNTNGREINETLDVRVQLARGTVFGENCPITNNQGRFQFVVPDSLKLPQARLSLLRPNTQRSREQFIINLSTRKPDLQFLPESGQLVAGIENQMAFRCVDVDGRPIAVSGILLEENKKTVAHFETEYEGMGSINFVPQKGTHYSARIVYRDSTFTYSIPELETGTYGLHITRNDQDYIYFSIRQDSSKMEDFILFEHTRGNAKLITTGTLTKTEVGLSVPKSNFPSGVAVFTLFVNGAPRAERLVYIDNNDPIKFEIFHKEPSYLNRSLVDLDILATDKEGTPVQGNFSLLAYDSGLDQSIDSMENIRNYLLFSSDLHGQVLANTDAFNPDNPNANRERDLLMLTNGWRRFTWTDIYQQSAQQKSYKIEQGITINGEIRRLLTNKPVPKNFEISLILQNKHAIHIDKTYTDEHGKFHFQLPLFTDSAKLTIQTKNRLGAKRDYYISLHSNLENLELDATSFDKIKQSGISPLVVNLSSPRPEKKIQQSSSLSQRTKIKQPRIDNYYFPGKDTFMIQEVEVRSDYLNQRDSMISKSGQPDVVIESAQLKKLTEEKSWYSNIWDLISDQVPGLEIVQEPYEKQLEKYYNLVIADQDDRENMSEDSMGFGGPAVCFKVTNNPNGHLYIFVDRDFLNNSYIPLYDFLTYMDPSEIESINFISKPKNYDINMLLDPDLANSTLSYINQTIGDDPTSESSLDQQSMLEYLQNDFEKLSEPPSFLFITTKSKGGIFASRTKGIQSMYLSGLKAPREFYAPKYTTKNSNNTSNDYRKTVFWEPNIKTDSTGFAHVSFYTNDSNNPIDIQVEGVTKQGGSGSKTFTLSRGKSPKQSTSPVLANVNSVSTISVQNPYADMRLYYGQVADKETDEPLAFANLTQELPYYHETTNSDGEFFLAKDRLNKNQSITISSPGYLSKTISVPKTVDKALQLKLGKAPIQLATSDTKVMAIVRTAIRKSQTYYSTKETLQGYNREVVQINDNTYGVNESAFNYSNAGWAGNPNTLRFETLKFKRMEDKEGHKLMQLKPNHRRLFYPLETDLLSLPPEFWQSASLNQFHFEIIGQLQYDGETCYKIHFEQNDRLVLPLQSGIVYIGKESLALHYANWTTTPNKRKYISYTSYLQSNPLDYQVQVEDDLNEASYTFINGQLRLQSTNHQIRILVDQKDQLTYKSRLSVVGLSTREFRNIQNKNSEMLINDGKSTHMMVKDATYRISPWVNSGMIKPEEKLVQDARFLHDITVYK